MLRALVVTCGLSALLVAVGPRADAVDAEAPCAPGVAHRGVTERYVENTLGAVDSALALGLGVEVDVRTTRNGRLMVLHDRKVNRVTDGRGPIAELTSRQVRRLRTSDGQQVPFVSQVLRRVAGRPGARLVLDLKSLDAEGVTRLGEALTRFGLRDRVQVISFVDALLADFSRKNPDVRVFRIFDELPEPEVARGYGAVRVRGPQVTVEWAEAMHALGVPFGIRDTEDRADWEVARVHGADSVITDDASGYVAWCRSPVG